MIAYKGLGICRLPRDSWVESTPNAGSSRRDAAERNSRKADFAKASSAKGAKAQRNTIFGSGPAAAGSPFGLSG
jgi:hypothetical protein